MSFWKRRKQSSLSRSNDLERLRAPLDTRYLEAIVTLPYGLFTQLQPAHSLKLNCHLSRHWGTSKYNSYVPNGV